VDPRYGPDGGINVIRIGLDRIYSEVVKGVDLLED